MHQYVFRVVLEPISSSLKALRRNNHLFIVLISSPFAVSAHSEFFTIHFNLDLVFSNARDRILPCNVAVVVFAPERLLLVGENEEVAACMG